MCCFPSFVSSYFNSMYRTQSSVHRYLGMWSRFNIFCCHCHRWSLQNQTEAAAMEHLLMKRRIFFSIYFCQKSFTLRHDASSSCLISLWLYCSPVYFMKSCLGVGDGQCGMDFYIFRYIYTPTHITSNECTQLSIQKKDLLPTNKRNRVKPWQTKNHFV